MLVGEQYSALAVKFFEEQPEKTAQLVQKGIAIADTLKDDPRYDHQWPSAPTSAPNKPAPTKTKKR